MSQITADIAGYRQLSQDEQNAVNRIKEKGEEIAAMLATIPDPDPRLLALAKTNMQQGFMWAVRSITKPTSFA